MTQPRQDMVYATLENSRYTPYLLAKKLGAKAVLESASFAKGRERFSLLMCEEAFCVGEDEGGVFFEINGEKKAVFDEEFRAKFGEFCASKDAIGRDKTPDILDALAYIASQNKQPEGFSRVPLPASGIGYLGYEFAAKCDKINFAAQEDELGVAESLFVVGHFYIILDHFTEQIHIFGLNYNEREIDLKAALQRLLRKINDLDFSYIQEENVKTEFEILTDEEESKESYLSKVLTLKEHIAQGDIIQAVPSRRVKLKSSATPFEVYGKIRKLNPSPYMFYINFGEFELVGASPESLIRVREGVATIHPIAGTTRRGGTDAQDALLSEQLANNKKERAEHLMLVDLARNDLNRVCQSGSVEVKYYAQCELFSHVIHLVSCTQGRLKEGVTPLQALRAAFPAGTVSGAPKISAMEILSRLEQTKRRFYAGAVGYLDVSGDLDFCICIRAALYKNGVFSLQAGGGIVSDSQPAREWEETCEKLGAMVDVLTLD